MNYKELFNRYKKGLVNEKEKQLVEQEIEKYEAIEEYLSENLDKEFGDVVPIGSFENQEEETAKIRKSIKNRLRKVVFTSVAVVVALYISIFYIVSGIVDRLYYNPSDVTQPKEQEYQLPDFYYDMQAYTSLNMPGYTIDSFTFQEPKGFGEHEVSYSLMNHFTEKSQRYFVDISRGRLAYAMDGIFSSANRFGIWEGFEKIQYHFTEGESEDITFKENEIQRKNEETIRYLNEINPLSYISMSIVFDEDLTMEEYYHMSNENQSLEFKWVGVRTVEPGTKWSEYQPMHLIGFNPNANDESSSNRRPDTEKYPLFYLLDIRDYSSLLDKAYPERISTAYEIHFKSRLEYLRDRESFVSIFDYNDYKTDFYDQAIDYIDKNGVKTYGVLVFGTAKEFLEKVDEIPYDSIYINEVLPTKPNIYYN